MAFIAAEGLRPGDRLPPGPALSKRLGVGRTVLNDAIRMLTAMGRVRARRGSGVYVAGAPAPFAAAAVDLSMPVDPEHMLSLFEFRATLETRAARLAAERIAPRELQALEEAVATTQDGARSGDVTRFGEGDHAFHRGIAEASRNPFLASTVATVLRLQDWAIELVIAAAPGSLRDAAAEHAAVYAAIRRGQPDVAAEAMGRHIETVAAAYQREARRRVFGKTAG